jgi:hypothetical protein
MTFASSELSRSIRTAAVTHVRYDDFYLNLWAQHYGRMIGRQNLFVILDGDDWTSKADLTGVNVIVLPRPRRRMRRDITNRRMQREQMDLLARLFSDLHYDYVIKGDCDEYLVPDPGKGVGLSDMVAEAEAHGAVYSSGINVVQDKASEPALDPGADVLSQRHLAILTASYCKVNLISRAGFEAGIRTNAGGHRVKGGLPVHASESYYMLHLGWCDLSMWRAQKKAHRLANDNAGTHKVYVDALETLFDQAAELSPIAGPFDSAMAAARREMCFTGDQRNKSLHRFNGGNFPWDGYRDYLVRLDDRFHGAVG